jgi:iron complex transport system substrate-binding protein
LNRDIPIILEINIFVKKSFSFLSLAAAGLAITFIAGCNAPTNTADNSANSATTNTSTPIADTAPVEAPKRVVALNSTNVEIIRELGKGETLVGIDRSAHMLGFPDLKAIKDIGHPYQPNVEGIISLKPDLVLATEENLEKATAEQLRAGGVTVKILEASYKDGLEGLKRRITEVAKIYNEPQKGQELIAKVDADAKALQTKVAAQKSKPKIFFLYAHGPGGAFITGTDSGADVLIKLAGGTNAASFTTGRKPLTSEAMVKAAPDAIIMLGRGMKAVKGIDGALKLPGVMLTPAGKNRKIIEVDNSIRWVGPRFPQFASKLHDELNKKS